MGKFWLPSEKGPREMAGGIMRQDWLFLSFEKGALGHQERGTSKELELKLAKDRRYKKLIIETDYETTMELIEIGDFENHHENINIEDYSILVQETEVEITHAFAEIGKQVCEPSV